MAILNEDTRVPVTLLTGFLGAGKTTLLNQLIGDPDAGRVAVIMNEFGDVGLDHDLIEESTEETILMQSGCLCCTIRGDLSRTLCSLMARRQRGELDFDRVVIETTGIADPGPILLSMVMDRAVVAHYRSDGVVTLADAATGPSTLDAQFEAVNQIAVADLIVLSKTDLVSEAELSWFESRIAGINSTARRIRADHGRVLIADLFGLSALRPNVTSQGVSDWLGASQPAPDPLAGISGLSTAAPKPSHGSLLEAGSGAPHDHRISSASIQVDAPIPSSVFDTWLDTLMALKGPDILRMKGIVHVEGMDWPFVFHAVQHIFDAPVLLKSWSGDDKTSRVVVIARDTTEEELQASLETLLLQPEEAEATAKAMMAEAAGAPS